MGETIISVRNISKCFKRYTRPVDRLKEILIPGKSHAEEFWALRNISLEIKRGETLGILGQNGSGKSTLLQIIAGTLKPTIGELQVNGRISALLELGSGFNPEFTGRQNVFFNGRILGLTQSEIEARLSNITSFADIGDFIDQPVKTYSSGMFVRLAFAVAIHVSPDILIVDEALSVGDGVFVHRCMAKIKEFQDNGGTILFVSHDVEAVTRLCTQTAWLKAGTLAALGDPVDVARQYQAWIYDRINDFQKETSEELHFEEETISTSTIEPVEAIVDNLPALVNQEELNSSMINDLPMLKEPLQEDYSTPPSQNPFTSTPYRNFANVFRFGSGRAEIIEFDVLDSHGKPAGFVYPGDELWIIVKAVTFSPVNHPIIGVAIYDHLRTVITGFNSYQLEQNLPPLYSNHDIKVEFRFTWPEIKGGNYGLEPAIADGTQEDHEILDWIQCPLNIISDINRFTFGIIRLPEVSISYQIQPNSGLRI